MKQILSGNDWLVSHFLPDEVSAVFNYVSQAAKASCTEEALSQQQYPAMSSPTPSMPG